MTTHGPDPGKEMHEFIGRLFPIHRSITGTGARDTLRVISEVIPLEIHEVPAGTRVLDWTVPPEWRIREAWIEDDAGRRIIDLAESNLHVEAYSTPVDTTMPWREVRQRIHTLPDRPGWLPYRTSYYEESWGFTMAHAQFEALDAEPDREYRVRIDSELADGSLTYGEVTLPGRSADEFLVWTHTCHPSLANDNLAGIAVAAWLARSLAGHDRTHTFRFVFGPATIGAITWLAMNRDRVDRIRHGLVLTGLGFGNSLIYKRSRRGDAPVDRAAAHVLRHAAPPEAIVPFEPFGYDERQFCSPGFDLPVGCLMRSLPGTYSEYHTSADDLDLVEPTTLAGSLAAAVGIVSALEANARYSATRPYGEPRLGPLGLYRQFDHSYDTEEAQRAVLWTLNLSDGNHDLLAVADRSGVPFAAIRAAADVLLAAGLLEEAAP